MLCYVELSYVELCYVMLCSNKQAHKELRPRCIHALKLTRAYEFYAFEEPLIFNLMKLQFQEASVVT
ncbi:hypothetical protein EYC84_010923 [Monilinia fructicola]|uniref:Uncharacterized protein n=1 Tax=Monilinia fructicola TaxID=38448 RepID=A0A5M9JD88_MONFR|nr:hypothetical protein EYC84_010923 [Monilinia fructicola]